MCNAGLIIKILGSFIRGYGHNSMEDCQIAEVMSDKFIHTVYLIIKPPFKYKVGYIKLLLIIRNIQNDLKQNVWNTLCYTRPKTHNKNIYPRTLTKALVQ